MIKKEHFRKLFLDDTPLMDVRAPIEFEKGAFPKSLNCPLLDNIQRQEIGICYKNKGPLKALQLGHKMITGETKRLRLKSWQEFLQNHPNGLLYCFRGGQRSQLTQHALYDAYQINMPLIEGGYKALRTFLTDSVTPSIEVIKPQVLSGRTGVGKTILLKKLKQCIDLEGLAHHRGSAFGGYGRSQPTQINFEHSLAVQLLKAAAIKNKAHILFEDEGNHIGSVHPFKELANTLKHVPIILHKEDMHTRVDITLKEYVTDIIATLNAKDPEHAFEKYSQYVLGSIDRLKKRLGGSRHKYLYSLMENAISTHKNQGSTEDYKEGIEFLLTEYYDPMYDYQIEQRKDQIRFQGTADEIQEYWNLLL